MRTLKSARVALAMLAVLALLGCGDDGGDGREAPAADPCAGPIPPFTENWGETVYNFIDDEGTIYLVASDGMEAGVGAMEWDPDLGDFIIVMLVGPVVDKYTSTFTYMVIDEYADGTIDWVITEGIEGVMAICAEQLKIYDVVIEGVPQGDVVASYTGSYTPARVRMRRAVPDKIYLLIGAVRESHGQIER